MRIAALGRSPILLDSIAALRAVGHDVPLIAHCPENTESPLAPDAFRACAPEVVETTRLDAPEVASKLRAAQCDVAVSVNWVSKIGQGARAAFRHGILNAHGGDLPRYRGNAPFAWAILNGEATVGLTIHVMDEGLDTGPIYLKRFVPLTPETYVGDLFRELATAMPAMFVEVVGGIADGLLAPHAQTGPVLQCFARTPADARIDWTQDAEQLGRLVRASAEPFAGAFTSLDGERLAIWRARPAEWAEPSMAVPGQVVGRDVAAGEVTIATGNGVLIVREVGYRGVRGAPMAVLRSLRTRVGP